MLTSETKSASNNNSYSPMPSVEKTYTGETNTSSFGQRLQQLNPLHKNKRIRTQLLSTILPTVLVPLAIASTISYGIVQKNAGERIQGQMSDKTLLSSEIASNLLVEALQISAITADNPLVVNSVRSASQRVATEKLNQLSIEQAEKKFAQTKLLQPNQTLNNYLRDINKNTGIAEIFFTEKHGYNVAYSNPTSDFVQSDEQWWKEGKTQGQWLSSPEFDESAQVYSIDIAQAIKDPQTGEFLGVMKAVIPSSHFAPLATYLENTGLSGSQKIQLLDTPTSKVIETITPEGSADIEQVIGGEPIKEMALALAKIKQQGDPQQTTLPVKQKHNLEAFQVSSRGGKTGRSVLTSSFRYQDREYYLATVPGTEWVTVASIDAAEVQRAGSNLIVTFASIALILGAVATAIILYLSNQLSKPVINLSNTAEEVTAGNLDALAQPEGSLETQTLANNFNDLVAQVKHLLQEHAESFEQIQISKQEAEQLAEEQRQQNEAIQKELFQLLSDVEGAASGDLTVRAQISDGSIGIVADFFNSIVESLRDIVTQVKQTTAQVNDSLGKDETAMGELASEASQQSQEIQRMLDSIDSMAQSIEEVAQNTQSVAQVAQKASSTAETGEVAMDETVQSIVELRETVGETAKKVKRLGESSQQISKVISLINQIALQTNLLAINASIEAARAGEEGRGFAVVAEEVGQLAAQSAEATKEIEHIVENIQLETSDVVEAMEKGTAQVVQGTRLVSQAKQSFGDIVKVSREIDELLQSISGATISQTKNSEMVTSLMKNIAKVSEQTSDSSRNISGSLQETVEIAQQLQASVETFKVGD